MLDAGLEFLRTYGVELGAAGGAAGVAALIWAIVKWLFSKPKPVEIALNSIDQIKPPQAKDGPTLTVPEFIRLRRELKADLEAELAEAAEAEKSQLRARIAELENQIANPEESLAKAQKRIADLEALLDREANQIGSDRIAEAKAALEQGDYSLADDIFAEIEAKNELAVQETARAAFGRGEVAEAEVRWRDAAEAYQRAARFDPCYRTLIKAHEFTHLAGDYMTALKLGEDLIVAAENEGDPPYLSAAKNDHAATLQAIGNYKEAEELFREALEIDREAVGEEHPKYATRLNNLALVVRAQGRVEEAKGLYRKALGIDRATIGEGHPNYATRLNNLAVAVLFQGRVAEAEGLYREALEIDRVALGEGHPSYAIGLGNLGQLLGHLDRAEEGRKMLEHALEIFRETLPPDHPHIAETERRLAALP